MTEPYLSKVQYEIFDMTTDGRPLGNRDEMMGWLNARGEEGWILLWMDASMTNAIMGRDVPQPRTSPENGAGTNSGTDDWNADWSYWPY